MKALLNQKLTFVMYHYVRDFKNTKYPQIKGLDIRDFEEQLLHLKRHYNCVAMEQAIEFYRDGEPLPPKALVLTFDDGYVDHERFVLPLLVKHRLQGSFYIPVRSFLERKTLDVNKIHILLALSEDKKALLGSVLTSIDKYRYSHPDLKILSYEEMQERATGEGNRFDSPEVLLIKQILQKWIPRAVAHYVLDDLIQQLGGLDESALHKEIYMDRLQLERLKSEGMHIGAHGYEHSWLDSLTADQLNFEMDHCVKFLEEMLVPSVHWTLCYPYGGYNSLVMEKAQTWGFQLALATKVDVASRSHRFRIPRLDTNDFPKSHLQSPVAWYFET